MKYSIFLSFFKKMWLFVVNFFLKMSGSGSKFNCAARVGSDDLGYGPGSGFSLKPVQTSTMKNPSVKSCHITPLIDTINIFPGDS